MRIEVAFNNAKHLFATCLLRVLQKGIYDEPMSGFFRNVDTRWFMSLIFLSPLLFLLEDEVVTYLKDSMAYLICAGTVLLQIYRWEVAEEE